MSSSLWGRQFKMKCQERHRIKKTHKTSKRWKNNISKHLISIDIFKPRNIKNISHLVNTYNYSKTLYTHILFSPWLWVFLVTQCLLYWKTFENNKIFSLFLCHSWYVSFLLLGAKSSIQFSQKQVLHIASNDHMAKNQICA